MYEQVARRILFDFEVITLLALVVGLWGYAWVGTARKDSFRGIGSTFQRIDLALVWVPLLFFLINPILPILFPQILETAEIETKSSGDQLTGAFVQFVFYVFVASMTLILLQMVPGRNPLDVLRLRRPNWFARHFEFTEGTPARWTIALEVMTILIFGIVCTSLSYFLCNVFVGSVMTEFLSEKLGELSSQKAVENLRTANSTPVLIFSIFLACVVAPLVEETLFRGYLYGVLKRFSSPLFAALISSALFAVVHLNLPALMPLWVFAIVLTLVYELTRSLWVPITIHAMFNATNVVLLFFVDQ